jgi:hypothetical protein
MISFCPTEINDGSAMLLAVAIASTVVSNRWAMIDSVSPRSTT